MKNIGKWCVVVLGMPMTYVCLPFSCCLRNPVAMVINGTDVELDSCEKMSENIATGFIGVVATVTCCCCCCGYGGEMDPVDF